MKAVIELLISDGSVSDAQTRDPNLTKDKANMMMLPVVEKWLLWDLDDGDVSFPKAEDPDSESEDDGCVLEAVGDIDETTGAADGSKSVTGSKISKSLNWRGTQSVDPSGSKSMAVAPGSLISPAVLMDGAEAWLGAKFPELKRGPHVNNSSSKALSTALGASRSTLGSMRASAYGRSSSASSSASSADPTGKKADGAADGAVDGAEGAADGAADGAEGAADGTDAESGDAPAWPDLEGAEGDLHYVHLKDKLLRYSLELRAPEGETVTPRLSGLFSLRTDCWVFFLSLSRISNLDELLNKSFGLGFSAAPEGSESSACFLCGCLSFCEGALSFPCGDSAYVTLDQKKKPQLRAAGVVHPHSASAHREAFPRLRRLQRH